MTSTRATVFSLSIVAKYGAVKADQSEGAGQSPGLTER